jgi:hypothetical protein
VSNEFEATSAVGESDIEQAARKNGEAEAPTIFGIRNLPRNRRRKSDGRKPLDLPEDEAIAQYLAAPKSIRDFRSFSELAAHFEISRMTAYRRSKDPVVLQRAEWLLTHHKLAGDLIARLQWERIVAGQVKAAVAGDTKAAQFCKEQAWPEDKDEGPLSFFNK